MKRIIAFTVSLIILFSVSITAACENSVTVTFSVYENVNNKYIYQPKKLDFSEGTTVLQALRSIDSLDVTVKNSTYVSAINGFAEFGHGKKSGWTYEVNGEFVNVPASTKRLRDGDRVEWIYVVDYVTAATSANAPSNNDKATAAASNAASNVAPSAAPNVNNTVSANTAEPPASALTTAQSSVGSTAAGVSSAAEVTNTAENATESSTVYHNADENEAVKNTLDFLKDNGGNFTPLALSLYSQAIPKKMKTDLIDQCADGLKATDYERLMINLSAVGESVTDANGINLKDKIFNNENLMSNGINGVIFALLSVPHCTLDKSDKYGEDRLISLLLQNQKPDGGFAITFDMQSDADITAMAAGALAPYKSRAEVSAAIDKAVLWLSQNQNQDGSFSSMGAANCESTAQTLIMMYSLGIDVNDARFVKNRNAYDALMSFYNGSGFSHTYDSAADTISSEQALLALYSYNNGVNPYSESVESHINEVNFTLIIVIALSVIAVCSAVLIIFKKKGFKI